MTWGLWGAGWGALFPPPWLHVGEETRCEFALPYAIPFGRQERRSAARSSLYVLVCPHKVRCRHGLVQTCVQTWEREGQSQGALRSVTALWAMLVVAT